MKRKKISSRIEPETCWLKIIPFPLHHEALEEHYNMKFFCNYHRLRFMPLPTTAVLHENLRSLKLCWRPQTDLLKAIRKINSCVNEILINLNGQQRPKKKQILQKKINITSKEFHLKNVIKIKSYNPAQNNEKTVLKCVIPTSIYQQL